MSSASFLRSSSSFAFALLAFDLATDFDAFEAAFFERVELNEDVEDFFPDLAVSFEGFFVAMRRTVTQLRVDFELLSFNHRCDKMS